MAKPGATGRKLRGMPALFVEQYMVDLNATQAAIRAGYSPAAAKQQGSRLLTRADVQAAVAEAMAKRGERTKVTADRVIQELAYLALSDIGEVLDSKVLPNGRVVVTIRNLSDLSPAARRCIKSIKQTTEETSVERDSEGEVESVTEKVVLQVELHPKVAALDLLMAHHGLKAPVKVDVTVEEKSAKTTLQEKLDGLRKRVAPGSQPS